MMIANGGEAGTEAAALSRMGAGRKFVMAQIVHNRHSRRTVQPDAERPLKDPGAKTEIESSPPGSAFGGARSVHPTAIYRAVAASTDVTDEYLLLEHKRGDTTSFTRLMERYQRELFHFLFRFLGDRAAAEDVFQETFLQVHQSAESFDPERRFRPWLFTIAANKARDLMRSQSRRPAAALQSALGGKDESGGELIDLLESVQEMPGEPLEREELAQRVRNIVHVMPAHLREILLLSYFHEFAYRQISEILNIPLGTVKSRLHSAVAYFADLWKSANKLAH